MVLVMVVAAEGGHFLLCICYMHKQIQFCLIGQLFTAVIHNITRMILKGALTIFTLFSLHHKLSPTHTYMATVQLVANHVHHMSGGGEGGLLCASSCAQHSAKGQLSY